MTRQSARARKLFKSMELTRDTVVVVATTVFFDEVMQALRAKAKRNPELSGVVLIQAEKLEDIQFLSPIEMEKWGWIRKETNETEEKNPS